MKVGARMNRSRLAADAAAKNTEALAMLAALVRAYFAEPVQAAWYSRIARCVLALSAIEGLAKGSVSYRSANAELQRAVDTTRKYAVAHELQPNTRRGVLQEARTVLESLR